MTKAKDSTSDLTVLIPVVLGEFLSAETKGSCLCSYNSS